VNISIFGNTIAIIGKYEEMKAAREAINMLLTGKNHTTVYKYLQKMHEEIERKKMSGMWKPASE
nr:RNA-processing protein [Candidatus Sigynarchaeota archaeon]